MKRALINNSFIINLFLVFFIFGMVGVSCATTAAEIDKEVDKALQILYESSPAAVKLSKHAKGILVFPRILKGGFIIGGHYGEGALRVNGHSVAYYKTVAGSYGLQAGVQSYGYALFFMTDKALKYILNTNGWEIGVGPSIVIVDKGTAKSLTTTTGKDDIYAFFFNQKGLMAGLGLQGSKITKFQPEK